MLNHSYLLIVRDILARGVPYEKSYCCYGWYGIFAFSHPLNPTCDERDSWD